MRPETPDLTRIPTVPPDAETSPCQSGPQSPRTPDSEVSSASSSPRSSQETTTASINIPGHQVTHTDTYNDPRRNGHHSRNASNTTAHNLQLQQTCTTATISPYRRLPLWRKNLIVFVTAFTALPITFASTSLFPLTQEISVSLNTTPLQIQSINAIVVALMGFSIFIWGPISKIWGRKNAWLAATAIFMLANAGTALAPDDSNGEGTGRGFAVFTAMRVISGLEGTFFHIAGQTYIADIFEPTARGTATGLFLVGTVFGPAFGPCFAGIMVTYTTWRAVLWLQVAMSAVGIILSIIFLPDIRRSAANPRTPKRRAVTQEKDFEKGMKMTTTPANPDEEIPLTPLRILKLFNPTKTFKVFLFPNVLLTDLACGCMSWAQYTLLAAPRHVLNPRFNLTTPLVSGLFYIAPGVGFIIGTIIGGRYSDHTVRKWIKARGFRLPQDRLLAGKLMFFAVIPAAMLVYGWCLHFNVGGLAVPVVFAAIQAFGLLFAFASLNTYCAEALPKRRSEVIASKYLVQYATSATGSAVIVPLIDGIGMGPATTLGAVLVLIAGVLSLIVARWGLRMERWAERKMPGLLSSGDSQ